MWQLLRWKYPKHSKKRMEQHFQDVAQKVTNDKNSDSFDAHFAKKFTQKTKSTTILQNYVFWYTFYSKPYRFNGKLG